MALELSSFTAHGFEASTPIEVGINASIDVEITIYAGFDTQSEELIENARRAAEKLKKDYGILAVVVPITVSWCGAGLCSIETNLPQLVVNGHPINMDGGIIDSEDIVDISIALLGEENKYGIHLRNQNLDSLFSVSMAR